MHFIRHIAVLIVFGLSLANVLTAAKEDKSTVRAFIDKVTEDWGSGRTSDDGCIWKGTSPFCDGGCDEVGHVVRETSESGDGETCWTGVKVLCCPVASLTRENFTTVHLYAY